MRKNAIIIAGILFAAGASQAQQNSSDRLRSSSAHYNPEFHVDDSTRDTATEAEYSVSYGDADISADSSIRGGSLDARGYRQEANDDEWEGPAHPLNPGKQADSSIRGGSINAREREWNHAAEPSSGQLDHNRHMKADSSIRGGSIEARGGRAARQERDFSSSSKYHYKGDRGDFGQGSSATWDSDRAHGSAQGSANWNSGDELQRDGMDVEAQSTYEFERNNDASVGGAVSAETGSATLDDVELQYTDPSSVSTDSSASAGVSNDLNSSKQLEQNISGEFNLENHGEISAEPTHFGSDISSDMEREGQEAVGRSATSESGSASSSELDVENNEGLSDFDGNKSSFQSNDPALHSADTPLSESDQDLLHRDNRAHGVGSLATGESGAAAVAESGSSRDSMARELKARLTREATGTHGMLRSDVARNIQVRSKGGEVTLTGSVPSERDKRMIEARALEMEGVTRVNNQLTVTPEADPATRNANRGHDPEGRISEPQD